MASDPAWQIESIITTGEFGDSCSTCHFALTMPNGLTIEIEYDSGDAQEVFYDIEIEDEEWAAEFFEFGLSDLRSRGFDEIADAVHDNNVLLRTTFQEWSDQHGVQAHLLGSRVTWQIWDRYSEAVPHVISICALDEDLRPSELKIDLDCFVDKTSKLQELFDQLSSREAKRNALRSQGADGTIDLLALRVLQTEGPLAEKLKNWACTEIRSDRYDHYYSIEEGNIRFHKRLPTDPKLEINGSMIRVLGMHLPDCVITKCIGSPITDIVDCDYFSDDMKIVNVQNRGCYKGNFVEFEISQPKYFFCSLSGRFWL